MHWIGSVGFALRSDNAAAIDAVRNALRSGLDGVVVQPLQRALDGIEPAGAAVRYRRVDVDLGQLGPDDLDAARLARRIGERLEKRLRQLDQGRSGRASFASEEAAQLASFLTTGTLAWPAPARALAMICEQLVAMDEQAMARLAAELQPLLAGQGAAAERLVRQCPAELVHRLAAALAARQGASLDAVPMRQSGFIPATHIRHWIEVLIELAGGQPHAARRANSLVAQHPRRPAAGGRAHAMARQARPGGAPLARDRAGLPAVGKDRSPPAPAEERSDGDAAPGALPVDAAGGVLLYPWLPRLFEAVSLLDRHGRFVSEQARARAVLLVHLLATGKAAAAEPDLPLAKLLCGMDFADVVPRRLRPTRRERAEIHDLLAAVIGHWSALGETSVAALRETFLERPGRLERANDDWRLTVERRGVDILLDRLPWPISLVKTPYMARPLRVDWR